MDALIIVLCGPRVAIYGNIGGRRSVESLVQSLICLLGGRSVIIFSAVLLLGYDTCNEVKNKTKK